MSIWKKLNSLGIDQKKINSIYSDNGIPKKVREEFANWFESQNWETDQKNGKTEDELLSELLKLITDNYPELLHLGVGDGSGIKVFFKDRYSNDSAQFVKNVRQMLAQEKEIIKEEERKELLRKIAVGGAVTLATTGATIVATPLVIAGLGFTSKGVAAGSAAAAVQSAVYGGATTGVFSAFQSAGVLGVSAATQGVLVGGANVITNIAAWKLMKDQQQE